MSKLPERIVLGPEEEARRLWSGAEQAFGRADEELIALCECLDLGLRAAEILVVQRLQAVKEKFPATIVAQLETPEPEVDVHRDAITHPRSFEFTDAVDLLSEDELDCVSPGLHRGWEDRRFSCKRSRATARQALSVSLSADEQEQLLVLAANRNRIFRSPPPVAVETGKVLGALSALQRLVGRLLDGTEAG